MAAVRHRSQHNHKASNPFSDYSHPPPLPPKSAKSSSKMPTAVPKSVPPKDLSDALRETVVLRDSTPRTRPSRSHTATSPPNNIPNLHANTRRSQSQDSAGVAEKSRQKRSGKKGSKHADVIDSLDITGVGPTFHHDGPFDACAPSRNRQRNIAPIHSWSPIPGDDHAVARYGDSAYPGAHAYSAFTNDYPEPPKKKVDAIAEAWGMHEPEPFEEFLAGGGKGDTPTSSIYNGRDSHGRTSRRTRDARDPKEIYREYLDDGNGHNNGTGSSRPRMTTRRTVPPPKPIFVPDPVDMGGEGSPNPDLPKRSKSLMQRIKRMRDSPNVPVGSDNEPSSPSGSPTEAVTPGTRPTHRPQNSFLGRFGGGGKASGTPPSSAGLERPEPYVFIEAHNKQLPATPGDPGLDAAPSVPYSDAGTPSGGAALGRKASLIQKVGRVVRGK